ncbi:MAG: CehA/McbA family metallohydrolase [Chloroflexi bacterium]|nr:CehA/McbA family metallohydrolase [Chloroflexota bacterium]
MNVSSVLTPDTLPFSQPGRFYRGNLHGHSTESDGRWTPAEYVRQYRQNGYDFVAITDHCIEPYGYTITDTRQFRCDDFTTLIGAELHPRQIESGSPWHLLAVGLPLDFETHRDGDTGASVARRAMEAGAFVAATHPNWYAFTVADFETLDAADAVECYNGAADAASDRGYSWHFIDMLLHRGHRVGAIAVDDVHASGHYSDFMRGWVHVKADALTPEALPRALKAGHYYSSTGPQLHHVELLGRDKLVVECSPAEQILLTGERAGALPIIGWGLRGAEFDLRDVESRWLRVTVRDEAGGRAWTNPVWLD